MDFASQQSLLSELGAASGRAQLERSTGEPDRSRSGARPGPLPHAPARSGLEGALMAKTIDEQPRPTMKDRVNKLVDGVQGSQAWSSIFRPGSIFRKGYTDSPRNRSYVIMNSVLYHLHPVKVKRHAVKVSYTLCLGGLSFFLFILLTVTGIFLMFFYRPEATAAWNDISNLQTSVTFGLLVRNMHRWGAHFMVLSVFLHMARVFYHGAYKPPREFNWVIGVILLMLTLLLSFTGYLLPWDQLALWAVTVGTNMMGYTPVFGEEVRFVLLGGAEIGPETLLRWYVLHVLLLPVHHRDLHGHPLLAGPQGRRDQWTALNGLARCLLAVSRCPGGRRSPSTCMLTARGPSARDTVSSERRWRDRDSRAPPEAGPGGRDKAARTRQPQARRRAGGRRVGPALAEIRIPAHLLERSRRPPRPGGRGGRGDGAAGRRCRRRRPGGLRRAGPAGGRRRAGRRRSGRAHPAPADGRQERLDPGGQGVAGRQGAHLAAPAGRRVRRLARLPGLHVRLLDLRQRPAARSWPTPTRRRTRRRRRGTSSACRSC